MFCSLIGWVDDFVQKIWQNW